MHRYDENSIYLCALEPKQLLADNDCSEAIIRLSC